MSKQNNGDESHDDVLGMQMKIEGQLSTVKN
jgi:hypothetical protein